MSLPRLLLCLCLALPPPGQSLSLLPPDLLLSDGIRLFSRGDWPGARGRLQGALRSLAEVRGVKLRCGASCGLLGAPGRLEEAVLTRADCLRLCERLELGEPSLHRLTEETERGFQRGAPYNYLQIIHYKLEELDEAAAAAFTFYVRNPWHEQITQDVQRYRGMERVRAQSFRDLEEPSHRVLYSQAVSLLSEGKFGPAVSRLEESLSLALSALEECRTLCEGTRESENETHRDLSEVIAEYYVQVLQCKQRCVLEDSVRPGQKRAEEDIIESRLSLLQDGYARLGDWEAAAQIARCLLLFHPQNETMRERLQEYEGKLQDRSKPRESIISYVRRAVSEKRLLYYAMENLGISFHDRDSWTPEEVIPESLREKISMEKEAEGQNGGDLPYEEVTVTLTPKQMNGTSRVTLDGVMTEEECEDLLRLAQMASSGTVDPSHARLYYHASERSRVLAQSYFDTKTLHFSDTHLVCRSAIEGEQEERVDLSHPVHADNCVLDTEEKECWKEPPAYVHRDYSGILYLNDDFQGGDLFFTELDGTTVTAELRPRCGRLVLFSAGGENAYGVRAVTRGRGYAIVLWFTESAEHAEQERSQAKILMGESDSNKENTEKDAAEGGRETTRSGRETTRSGRETSATGEETSGRRQKKRASRKFEDEL
ncbi:prolyl 3-hydroxylase 3 isoform X2 [Ascaphus truei]|uniref:prolyl 3-hydroxylase 3 isoform X2 n=1 Tax=Ascaphus truei TaxID=8439 RepID=UPI003F592C55